MNFKKLFLCAAGFVALSTAAASASSYQVNVLEGYYGGITAGPVSCSTSAPAVNTACASFTYTGALNFNNNAAQNSTNTGDLNSAFGFSATNVSNYVGAGHTNDFDFRTETSYLNSSGSVQGQYWASYYSIDLGVLAAGTILTINHDDGIAMSGATGTFTSGATTAVSENAYVTTTGDVKLYYTRQNGTPSILQVAVPEPASLSIFGAALLGLAGMAGLKRRNRKSV